ncbi:MAG TPA: NarK family nitrate/nitrite MFS transporter [Polyangiaceae bacterium]|nr:NarK family nitrate/nitrite MFS transporter [Polyangiaceae bacterium]
MSDKLNLLNLRNGSIRTLHLAWIAFFLTFVIWFNHAPLLASIQASFGLSSQQVKALMILNVALTIPARIAIGILVDKFGPRRTFTLLLLVAAVVSCAVAVATSFEQLALFRFLLGFVGAGFVIGIRLVGEWFPAKQVGLAEGIYGGWGNFGAAAAAITLPTLAALFGGPDGWRYAMGTSGVIALLYSVVFYWFVRDTPKGSTYFKPKRAGGLEVTSTGDFFFLLAMNVPLCLALAALTWKLGPGNLGLLSATAQFTIYGALVLLYAFQSYNIFRVNREIFVTPVPEQRRYAFKQVAILAVAYLVSFGSELAVVSMLPLFFMETFEGLGQTQAALFASTFALMNLAARPGGGWLSDRFGRRRTLMLLIAGLAVGYFGLSRIDGTWFLPLAVLVTMVCSFFVQAAAGAVFSIVPLVQRRMTGQIAGMTGAYGNVGGVTFLTILSFVDYSTFFLVIAVTGALTLLAILFLDEPEGHMVEVADDGTVQLIEVSAAH